MDNFMAMIRAEGAPEAALAARTWSASGLLARTALATLIAFNPMGGAASAQTPVTLFACLNPAGQVRLVQGPDACRKQETAVSWNVVGATGPTGPTGAASTVPVRAAWPRSELPG